LFFIAAIGHNIFEIPRGNLWQRSEMLTQLTFSFNNSNKYSFSARAINNALDIAIDETYKIYISQDIFVNPKSFKLQFYSVVF